MRIDSHRRQSPSYRLVSSALICGAMAVTSLCHAEVASAQSSTGSSVAAATAARDSAEAFATFRENIAAIHNRDKARYLATYVHTSRLVRHSPSAL